MENRNKIFTEIKNKKKRFGPLKRKVLILLAGGVSLAFASNPRKRSRILKQIDRELEKFRKDSLNRAIKNLYESKLIDFKEKEDGSVEIVLNKEGKQIALKYKLEEMKIKKMEKWDGKWRIIVFDIPEKLKEARNALRFHLKKLGFYQLQKSTFVIPYKCSDEIDFIIELYNLRRYVRSVTAEYIDNELHLKKIFNLKTDY